MNKFLALFFLLILAFFSLPLIQGQPPRLVVLRDSFHSPELSDAQRSDLAFKIAEQFRNTPFLDSSLYYATEGLALAHAAGIDKRVQYYDFSGQMHFKKGSYLLASRFFQTGRNLAIEEGDLRQIGLLSNSTGISYAKAGNYEEALTFFRAALEIFDQMGKSKQILSAQKNMAQLYAKLNQPQQALDILEKVFEQAIEGGFDRIACRALLGQGEQLEVLEIFPKAEDFFQQARTMAHEKGYIEQVEAVAGLGRLERKKGNFEKANAYLSEALALAQESKRNSWISKIHQQLALLKMEKQDFKAAQQHFQSALDLNNKENTELSKELYLNLAALNRKTGNHFLADHWNQKLLELMELQARKNKKRQVAELEESLRIEKEMQRLRKIENDQKQKQYLLYGSTLLGIMAVLGSFLLLSRYRIKQRSHKLLASRHAELTQTYEKLKQAHQDFDGLLHTVSHDLKEPLSTLRMHLELIGEKESPPQQQLNQAHHLATNMETMLRDLLTYAKASNPPPTFVSIDLNQVFKEVQMGLEAKIKEKKAQITIGHLPTLPALKTDVQLLFQNLIQNALKFHKPGIPPIIEVSAAIEKNNWIISITDNGIGLSPQEQKQVFDIFWRLHSQDHYPGSGMGLANCKRITHRLGWTIGVESVEGEGARFWIRTGE